MARLAIKPPGRPEQLVFIEGPTHLLGRGRGCDVRIPDDRLSRKHCRLEQIPGGYRLHDLGSRNGTRLNHHRLGEPTDLTTGDLIRLGGTQILYIADSSEDREDDTIAASQTVVLDAAQTEEEDPLAGARLRAARYVLQYTKGDSRRLLPLGAQSLTIGRHPSCGLILNDKSVSQCHARIDYEAGDHIVRDLGSTNGVTVNGRKVSEAVLRPGSRIRFGRITVGFKELVRRPEDDLADLSVQTTAYLARQRQEGELDANDDTPQELILPADEWLDTDPAEDSAVSLPAETGSADGEPGQKKTGPRAAALKPFFSRAEGAFLTSGDETQTVLAPPPRKVDMPHLRLEAAEDESDQRPAMPEWFNSAEQRGSATLKLSSRKTLADHLRRAGLARVVQVSLACAGLLLAGALAFYIYALWPVLWPEDDKTQPRPASPTVPDAPRPGHEPFSPVPPPAAETPVPAPVKPAPPAKPNEPPAGPEVF